MKQEEVTAFIEAIGLPWQVELAGSLRNLVHETGQAVDYGLLADLLHKAAAGL